MSPASPPLARALAVGPLLLHAPDSATYGLVVLVVATILVPCLSAPLRADEADVGAVWWYNACSHHTRHNDMSKLKAAPNCTEPISKNLKHTRAVVKNQLSHFKQSYEKEMKLIETLYKAHVQITPMANKSLLLFSWLPESTKFSRTIGQALVKFHEDLQRYAVAIRKLERLEVHTNIQFDLKKRKLALGKITDYLRLLLCEIETAVNLTCQPLPQRIPPTFPDGTDADADITRESDLTVLIPQEWSVLTRLKKYVRSSQRSFKQILRNGNVSEPLVDNEEDGTMSTDDSSVTDASGED